MESPCATGCACVSRTSDSAAERPLRPMGRCRRPGRSASWRGPGGWSAPGGARAGAHQPVRAARLSELGRRVRLPLSGADAGGRTAVECAPRAGRGLRIQLRGPGTRAGVRQFPDRLAAGARGGHPPGRARLAREPGFRGAVARAGLAARYTAVRLPRGPVRRGAGGGLAVLLVQRRLVLLAHILRSPAAWRRVPVRARRSDAGLGAPGGRLAGRLGRARALLHRRRLRRADRVLAAPAGDTPPSDRRARRPRRAAVGGGAGVVQHAVQREPVAPHDAPADRTRCGSPTTSCCAERTCWRPTCCATWRGRRRRCSWRMPSISAPRRGR